MCMDKSASLPTTERILRSRVNLVQQDTTLKQLKVQKQMYNLHQLWKVTLKDSRPDNNPPVACLDVTLLRLCPINKPPRELVGLLLDPF